MAKKKKKKNKYLDLSAFKDGYDFGDVTKTIVKSAKKTSKTLQKNAEKSAKSKTTNKKGKTTSGSSNKKTVSRGASGRLATQIGYKPTSQKKNDTKTDFLSFLDRSTDNISSATKNLLQPGKLYNKGYLKDGVSYSTLQRSLLSSSADSLVSTFEAAGRFGEKAIDWGADVLGKGAGALGNKDFQKKMERFAEKDFIDEEKSAISFLENFHYTKGLMNAAQAVNGPNWREGSLFGETSRDLLRTTGEVVMLGPLGKVGKVGKVLPKVAMGVSAYGGSVEEAYRKGATGKEAGIYGITNAVSEVALGKLFKGVKYEGKALTETAQKAIVNKISNTTLRTMTNYGIDVAGEGAEEVAQELVSNVAKKLTFEDEKTWNELLASEEAMENYIVSAIGGSFASGAINAGNVANSIKTGRDYDTGLTDNEQKVIDREVEDRVNDRLNNDKEKRKKAKVDEAIEEFIKKKTDKHGTLTEEQIEEFTEEAKSKFDYDSIDYSDIKLSKKDRNKIEEQVRKDLERGEIDTFTIEDTLFRDNALRMRQLSREMETAMPERKAQIEAELQSLDAEYNDILGKSALLQESYRQRLLADEKLDYKLDDNASDKAKKLVQSAIESGADNTRKTHEQMDFLIKMADDTDIDIEFVNDEELEQLGHYDDVKDLRKQLREAQNQAEKDKIQLSIDKARQERKGFINALADKKQGNILINVKSGKMLETLTGHEITHFAEKLSNDEKTGSYDNLKSMLKEYAESKGEWKQRLEEAERLYKSKVEGKTDAEKLEYYEQEVTADLVGEYIFSDQDFINNLSVKEPNVFKKAYDYIKHAYKMATAGSAEARKLEQAKRMFDKAYKQISKTVTQETKTNSLTEADSNTKFSVSDGNIKDTFVDHSYGESLYRMQYVEDGKELGWIEYGEYDGEPNVKMIEVSPEHRRKGIGKKMLQALQKKYPDIEINYGMTTPDGTKLIENATYQVENKEVVDKVARIKEIQTKLSEYDKVYDDFFNDKIPHPGENFAEDYNDLHDEMVELQKEVSGKKATKTFVKFSLSDTNGRELTKAQQDFFKDSKVRDENGNLKVMYHGSEKAGFHIFDTDFTDDGRSHFFTDDNTVAKSYSGTNEKYAARTFKTAEDLNNFFAEIGVADEYEVREENGKFVFYDEGEAEATSDTAVGIYEEFRDWTGLGSGSANYEVYLNIKNPLVIESNSDSWDHVLIPKEIQEDMWEYLGERVASTNTRTYSAYAKEKGYDGVIFKRIIDTGIYASNMEKYQASTVAVAFDFDQIKSVANENPTSDPDIRYSVTEDSAGRQLSENQQKHYRHVSPLLKDENGRLKRYYHGTSRGDRVGTIFDPERATSGPMAYFTDDPEIATNYSKSKADTSMAYDSDYDRYETQFRVEIDGEDMSLIDAWRYLPQDARARIKDRAEHTHYDWDDYETLVYDEDTTDAGGGFQWQIKEFRGNIFAALNEQWLNSGNLFGEEASYLDVLEFVGVNEEFEKLGYGKPYYKDPDYREEKVYEVYLNITNPLNTDDIDEEFLADVTDYIENTDLDMYNSDGVQADMWDKHNMDPYEWLEKLERDIENNTTYAWTSIPDVVTDFLKEYMQVDGIVDTGGKFSEISHQVVIPFYSEQVKNIDNENPTDNPDIRYSISEDDIAPVKRETGRALTEADLPYIEQQGREALRHITEDYEYVDDGEPFDLPPIDVDNPFEDRNIDEVGNRKVKAYMYENPEVKPFFQEEAEYMLRDLQNSVKGEKFYNDKLYYESSGEQGFFGTKRQTTNDIAYLLDTFSYTYADIEKGLKAIIEDHGAENNAISKRIEFALNDRLMDGYDAVDGTPIPANDDYRALIGNMQIQAYSEANYNAWVKSFAGVEAPVEDVSDGKVIKENVATSEDVAPVKPNANAEFFRQATKDNINQQTAENIKAYEQESKPKPPIFKEVSTAKKRKHGIGSAVDTFYSQFVNRNRQQDKLAKQTKNMEIKFKGDRVNNIAGEVGGDIFTAQTDNYGNRIGKSLDAPFEQARNAKLDREFDDYLKHQSNIERHKQGKGSVVPAETSMEYVSAYEQVHPEFKEWAKDVYTYNQNLLNNAVENGLIDKDFRAYLTGTYGHYVPFYSAEMSQPSVDLSPDEIRSGRPIKKAVGGADVTLQGVEQAMIKQTYAYMNAIAKNDLYKEIAQSVGGGGITPDMRTGDPTELTNLLYEDEGGKYLTAFIKGEPYSVNISEELYTELKRDLDTQIRDIEEKYGIITKPLQKISQLRGKLLTTYNPSFIVTNPIKDVQDALLNTKHTFRYIKNIGSAITDSSKVDSMDWYAERFKDLTGQDITTVADTGNLSRRAKHYYNKYQDGAMWSRFITSYGMNATQLEYMDDIDIDIKKSSKKAKNKGFLNKLSNANNFMEVMFRYPEFKATLEKGKSFTEALYNAREVTTNFGRGGTISKAINRNGATFFNTSVQGMDKFFRNFSLENGAKGFMSTVSKAVILGMTPAILNHILLGGGYDDEYEALPEYVKSNYYLFRRGNGEFIRIPKGRMISVLGSAARLNLEASMGKVDPTIAKEVDNKEFLRNAQDQIGASNPLKENIFAPVTQALKNEAWYGDDIVPYRLQNLPAKEQYDASTDEFSKWLGEKLNVSPYKVNYVLDQYSGGIGDALLPMMTPEATSDAEGAELLLAPIRDKFVVNSTDDNRYVGELFDLSDELKVQTNSSEATLDDVMNYEYISDIASQMGELYALKREIQADETLSKSEKYEETRKVQELINELATEGVRNYNSGASIDLAYEMHPDAVVSKVYADYNTYNTYKRALWDFKADKDKNGKTIIGSKQEKIIDYLNETDLDYGERIILFKQQYKSNDTYNEDIIDYLNSRDDLYYEDVVVILESLGFTVKSDGTVEW